MATKSISPPAAQNVKLTHIIVAAIDDLLGLQRKVEKILKQAKGKVKMTKLSDEEKEALRLYEEGLQKTLDIIAPAGMAIHPNELVLNDMHSRTLYAVNWPHYVYPNWLSEEINFDAHMNIAQFIYPANNKTILRMLRKKVTQMRSSIHMLEQRGIVRDPGLEAALQDAEELRDLLTRGREKLFQLGLYVTIYSDDEEKLKKLQTDIESLLGGKLVITKSAYMQMEHGWISTLPFGIDELEINRNMNTSPAAACFPFSSSDLTDDHGILYGINRHNDSLVIFDRFDLPNANATVFATSGAGKSFAVKLEILRYLMFDAEVYVIDPENEYSELCETVNGTHIPISLESSNRINPFELPKAVRGEEASIGETLRASVINLHGLFKLMLGTLTPAEDGILDKAILDTYALKGITLSTENPAHKEVPTMHDLVDVLLTTEGGENMARTLTKYTDGSYAGLFDRPTNVVLDNQMVVFQIRDLEEQLRPVAMYVVINLIWNRIRADFRKRILVIDEAWNLIQHEDSARFLYGLIKRARKYYLGVTTITQDVEDFVNSPYGKPIITNASLQMLLKQSATAIDNLQKIFYLTEGEKFLLLGSDVGQGLFFAGNRHVAIQIIASAKEEEIITTQPEDILAKKERKKREKELERMTKTQDRGEQKTELTTQEQEKDEKPFDDAQGKPFDDAQGKPFDDAQGKQAKKEKEKSTTTTEKPTTSERPSPGAGSGVTASPGAGSGVTASPGAGSGVTASPGTAPSDAVSAVPPRTYLENPLRESPEHKPDAKEPPPSSTKLRGKEAPEQSKPPTNREKGSKENKDKPSPKESPPPEPEESQDVEGMKEITLKQATPPAKGSSPPDKEKDEEEELGGN